MTKTKILFTLIMGVASLRVATTAKTHESDLDLTHEKPIETAETDVGERRVEVPEVVLQLKYDGGELNRIYLTQFRKGAPSPWVPSVPARTNLCSDLCHAGLGGKGCGTTCRDLTPVGLEQVLHEANITEPTYYGVPRFSVCPTLCENNLGEPLCNCGKLNFNLDKGMDWSSVCSAFCQADRYVLGGCPVCDENISTSIPDEISYKMGRILTTNDGWTAWCNVQCRQGQGGAACNCDRAPFQ